MACDSCEVRPAMERKYSDRFHRPCPDSLDSPNSTFVDALVVYLPPDYYTGLEAFDAAAAVVVVVVGQAAQAMDAVSLLWPSF